MRGRYALSTRSNMPRKKWVVVPRNMVVVPLHHAGAIQNGLGFEVSAWRGRGGGEVERALTLMTTAKTIGPRVSSTLTRESMAAARLQLWIHGTEAVGDGEIGRGGGGTMGTRERLGKGGLFVQRKDTYKRYPRIGNAVDRDCRKVPITHSMEAYPLMSMSPAHAPHLPNASRAQTERQPRRRKTLERENCTRW